jgi:hypothetical protein
MATRTRKPDPKQNRGNNPITVRTIRSFLTVNPASTIDEIVIGTGMTRQTVSYAVDQLAEPQPGTWPRRWVLDSAIEIAPSTGKAVPLTQTWARWIKATTTWPNAISKLSRAEDPRAIAAGLEQLASNAAALAVSFRAVQDEPDWQERIGA